VSVLAMFPLGSILLPHQPLALHVFEPRYRALVHDCLAGDRPFGVVLIERGSEVGGGDARFDIGCTARIVGAEESPDGRWALACTGEERFRVRAWLEDDPYPRAEVEVLDDGGWTADAAIAMQAAVAAFRHVVDLATQLGATVDPGVLDLHGPALRDQWDLAARAPIADLDKLGILAADTPERRLDLLTSELAAVADVLASRLGGG
jgi:Lon protease-like protein